MNLEKLKKFANIDKESIDDKKENVKILKNKSKDIVENIEAKLVVEDGRELLREVHYFNRHED